MAADWLEGRDQLGRDVFGRGQAEGAGQCGLGGGGYHGLAEAVWPRSGYRQNGTVYWMPGAPFWSVSDAAEQVRAMLPLIGE